MWHVENRSEMSVLDRLRFFTMKAEQAVERTNEITKMFFPVILLMAVIVSRFPGMRIFIWMMRAGRISWRISVRR